MKYFLIILKCLSIDKISHQNENYTVSTIYLQEILLAQEWAKLNNVPFPPVDPHVFDREGMKECYVFEDPDDPRCPTVLHFVLVNITFRNESKPGKFISMLNIISDLNKNVVTWDTFRYI